MAHITPAEANAWLESTKLDLSTIEAELDAHIASLIFSRLAPAGFSVEDWDDAATTPVLVRTIIAMYYVAAIYDRTYADDVDDSSSNYAATLRALADQNIAGLINGSVELEEEPDANAGAGSPSFFPTDASSDNRIGFHEDPSYGGPAFLMGQVF